MMHTTFIKWHMFSPHIYEKWNITKDQWDSGQWLPYQDRPNEIGTVGQSALARSPLPQPLPPLSSSTCTLSIPSLCWENSWNSSHCYITNYTFVGYYGMTSRPSITKSPVDLEKPQAQLLSDITDSLDQNYNTGVSISHSRPIVFKVPVAIRAKSVFVCFLEDVFRQDY